MPVKLSRANITPLTFIVLVFKNIEIVLYNNKIFNSKQYNFVAFINEDISTNVSQSTSGRIPLALSLVARLTAMGVMTGTSAGIAVYRGLTGGLDRTIAPAAAAQDLAVRGVTTDLGVQIRQRLVAIDIKVAGGIGGTAILPRVGNLVRMRVRSLVVVSGIKYRW